MRYRAETTYLVVAVLSATATLGSRWVGVGMTGLEAAAAAVGKAVIEKAGRQWLAGRAARSDGESELVELIAVSFPDRFVRRRVERQLGGIADSVEKRLYPLIEHEYRGLSENDRAAVAVEIVAALRRADLSDAALFAADVDSVRLSQQLRGRMRGPSPLLGEAGAHLYDVLLDECCDCLIRIVRQLPEFMPRAVSEILPRLSVIADQVSAALDRLPVRSLDAPSGTQDDAEFERRYREHLSETMDEIELFGVRVVNYRPRATLSVAYISLNVTAEEGAVRTATSSPQRLKFAELTGYRERAQATMRAETALTRSPRLLLRGQAGSGKSTLLRWIAVMTARGGLSGDLADWEHRVPFLVKLRSYAVKDLPGSEDFIGTPLGAFAPRGWVHRVLNAGRGVLLVDGVDELPSARRGAVREWLRDLLAAYPAIRVIVTTRPAAADTRWLTTEGFSSVMLEPMTPVHLRELVRQWHAAVQYAESLPCAPGDLPSYERTLLARFEAAPHLRALAATPLLAALICALNLDRSTHLPRDRMGLYSAALELLLERRDIERNIPSQKEITLEREQKIRLLQELAWQLTVFGRAEMSRATALARIAEKLASMPRVGAEPGAVLDYLVQRSGVIREPVPGRIDFLHRTIQEYLAAREAADNADIDPLIARAHLDQWRETIVMTVGHANAPLRRELLEGLLQRAAAEPRYSHRLRMLAVACLETTPDLPVDLRHRMEECLERFIPPRNVTEARPLSMAGEEITRRLPDSLADLSTGEAVATVRAAWMINGPAALDKLARYAVDARVRVQDELLAGWEYFDPTEYAQRVLKDAPLHRGILRVQRAEMLPTVPLLRNLQRLVVDLPRGIELDCLVGLPSLTSVSASGITADSLEVLAEHKQLWNVSLYEVPGAADDMSPLFELPKLNSLYYYAKRFPPNIEFLERLPRLKYLGISRLHDTEDFSPISRQNFLLGIWLYDCPGLTSVNILRPLTKLRMLSLRGARLGSDGLAKIIEFFPELKFLQLMDCEWLGDIDLIPRLPLTGLALRGSARVTDLSPLRRLKRLTRLWLNDLQITDLAPIRDLKGLRRLSLSGSKGISDLTPLMELRYLRHLYLQGAAENLDLSPLRHLRNLTVILGEGQRITGAEHLGRTIRIEWAPEEWSP